MDEDVFKFMVVVRQVAEREGGVAEREGRVAEREGRVAEREGREQEQCLLFLC
jgi:hypothetical protein